MVHQPRAHACLCVARAHTHGMLSWRPHALSMQCTLLRVRPFPYTCTASPCPRAYDLHTSSQSRMRAPAPYRLHFMHACSSIQIYARLRCALARIPPRPHVRASSRLCERRARAFRALHACTRHLHLMHYTWDRATRVRAGCANVHVAACGGNGLVSSRMHTHMLNDIHM